MIRHFGRKMRIVSLVVVSVVGFPLQAQGALRGSIAIEGARTEVVLSATSVANRGADDLLMSTFIHGCRRATELSAADSAAVLERLVAPSWSLPSAPSASILTMTVLPAVSSVLFCADATAQGGVAAVRGLRVTYDTLYHGDRDVQRVVLHRGATVVAPLASEGRVIMQLTPRGLRTNGASLIRLAIDIEELAPDSSGVRDDLWLEVWNASDTLPDRVPLPWRAVRAAWEWFYASRAARSSGAGDPQAPDRLVIERLRAGGLSAADERRARVDLGFSFGDRGDSSAARVLLGGVLDRTPCLTLDASAPENAKRLMNGLRRPAARCTANSLAYTALRGALLPGFGRPTTRARKFSNVFLIGAMSAGMVLGQKKTDLAREAYDVYLGYDPYGGPIGSFVPGKAGSLYDVAEGYRQDAKTMFTLVGALWAGSIVEGVWRERRHARALAEVRGYGRGSARASFGLMPDRRAEGVALSVALSW